MEIGRVEFSPRAPTPQVPAHPAHEPAAQPLGRMMATRRDEIELRRWCIEQAIASGAETAEDVVASAAVLRKWIVATD